jgi:hypothetical protein
VKRQFFSPIAAVRLRVASAGCSNLAKFQEIGPRRQLAFGLREMVAERAMRTTEAEFGILDLLTLLQETGAIHPINAESTECDVCGRPHFRQWFRAQRGHRFYVCTVARHATMQDHGGWKIVGVHDLVRWLISSLVSQRAA